MSKLVCIECANVDVEMHLGRLRALLFMFWCVDDLLFADTVVIVRTTMIASVFLFYL